MLWIISLQSERNFWNNLILLILKYRIIMKKRREFHYSKLERLCLLISSDTAGSTVFYSMQSFFTLRKAFKFSNKSSIFSATNLPIGSSDSS